MIQCRCVEMVYGELQTRALKCLMGAIIKGFLPEDFLIPLIQWKRDICNSIELNHCIKKVLDSKENSKGALGKTFLSCLILYFSHRGMINFDLASLGK